MTQGAIDHPYGFAVIQPIIHPQHPIGENDEQWVQQLDYHLVAVHCSKSPAASLAVQYTLLSIQLSIAPVAEETCK